MNLYTTVSLLFFLGFLLPIVPAGAGNGSPDRDTSNHRTVGSMQVTQGIVIVCLNPSVRFDASTGTTGVQQLDKVMQRIGMTGMKAFHVSTSLSKGTATPEEAILSRTLKIAYSSNESPEKLAGELTLHPEVEYAEPYYIFPLNHTPDDPNLSSQWAIAIMKMQEAWDITTGDSTVVIGDVDTGVEWTHEDLSLSIWTNPGEWGSAGELKDNGVDDDGNGFVDDWHGWDFIGNGSGQSPNPDNNPNDGSLGHGTNTSGCAAASTNNGKGIAGTGYNVKILPIKAAADQTAGIAGGYEGIKYAADMGCKVINCSWGSTGPFSRTLQNIIDYVHSRGALVVASSGNDPVDNDYRRHWPSSFNHVLNVGSIERSGNASMWCTFGTSVHVYAPGTGILTTRRGNRYSSPTGTSFSAPLTAGVAALVFSIHPDWTPDQVLKQIRVTADPFNATPFPKYFARVNAFKAVSLNQTLSDVPGIVLKRFSVVTPAGSVFTAGGQTGTIEFELENILAPTSANAIATIEFDDDMLKATGSTTVPLGEIPTSGTKTISFTVIMKDGPLQSEGSIPVRLKIEDGIYYDFVMDRAEIYLEDGWHTSLAINLPRFTAIHAVDGNVAWTVADRSQNNAPVADYCYRSVNSGNNWFNAGVNGFPSGSGVYCVRGVNSMTALVGTGPSIGNAAIYKTTDGGQNWTRFPVTTMTGFVNFIYMFDEQNGMFQGDPKDGIWAIGKTTDGGATWSAISTPLAAESGEAGWNESFDFIGDIGWFGTNKGKLYKTTDRGETWFSQQTPSLHSVQMSFRDMDVGAVHFSSQSGTGSDTIAVTTDGGTTWSLLSTIDGLFSNVQMERGGHRMWVLRDANAFVSADLGKTWTVQPVPNSFAPITVMDSWSDQWTTWVYGAGYNIFSFTAPFDPVTSVSDNPGITPAEFSIDYVYPNPATATTPVNIGFTLQHASATSVAVFDDLGREVRHGFNAMLSQGAHRFALDISGLTPGAYHCRITSNGTSQTRSLLVIQ